MSRKRRALLSTTFITLASFLFFSHAPPLAAPILGARLLALPPAGGGLPALPWEPVSSLPDANFSAHRPPAPGCPPPPALCRLEHVFDEILVLSLPRFAARASRVVAQLRALGAPFTLIHAHDARVVGAVAASADLRPGEFALRLTHVAVLEHVQRSPFRNVLLVEDDATIASDFPRAFDALARALPPDWRFLTLGQTLVPIDGRPACAPVGFPLALVLSGCTRHFWGSFAVALERESAGLVLRELLASGKPIDTEPYKAVRRAFPARSFLAWPPLVAMDKYEASSLNNSGAFPPADWMLHNGVEPRRFDLRGPGFQAGADQAPTADAAQCGAGSFLHDTAYSGSNIWSGIDEHRLTRMGFDVAEVARNSVALDGSTSASACCAACAQAFPVCTAWRYRAAALRCHFFNNVQGDAREEPLTVSGAIVASTGVYGYKLGSLPRTSVQPAHVAPPSLEWVPVASLPDVDLSTHRSPASGCPPPPELCRLEHVFDEILVLSLPRFAARASRIVAQLRALGAPFTLIHAHDARGVGFLTPGWINARPEAAALLMTHVAVAGFIERSPFRNVLVLEDGATFAANFPRAFDLFARALPPGWRFLQLGQLLKLSGDGPRCLPPGPAVLRASAACVTDSLGSFAAAFERGAMDLAGSTLRQQKRPVDISAFPRIASSFPGASYFAWPPLVATSPFDGPETGSSWADDPATWMRANGVTAERFDLRGPGYVDGRQNVHLPAATTARCANKGLKNVNLGKGMDLVWGRKGGLNGSSNGITTGARKKSPPIEGHPGFTDAGLGNRRKRIRKLSAGVGSNFPGPSEVHESDAFSIRMHESEGACCGACAETFPVCMAWTYNVISKTCALKWSAKGASFYEEGVVSGSME